MSPNDLSGKKKKKKKRVSQICKSDIERHPELVSGSHNQNVKINFVDLSGSVLKQVQNDEYNTSTTPIYNSQPH